MIAIMGAPKFSVRLKRLNIRPDMLDHSTLAANEKLAIQAAKDTEKFVPMLTGSLSERTRITGGDPATITYPGPYARYLYHGKVMVDAATGKGPSHFVDKNGNEVVAFPKGSKLKATDRDLVFNKASHADAQAHWFEASKSLNLAKWLRIYEKAVINNK